MEKGDICEQSRREYVKVALPMEESGGEEIQIGKIGDRDHGNNGGTSACLEYKEETAEEECAERGSVSATEILIERGGNLITPPITADCVELESIEMELRKLAREKPIEEQIPIITIATRIKELRVCINAELFGYKFPKILRDKNFPLGIRSVMGARIKRYKGGRELRTNGIQIGLAMAGEGDNEAQNLNGFIGRNRTVIENWGANPEAHARCQFLGRAFEVISKPDPEVGTMRFISETPGMGSGRDSIRIGEYCPTKPYVIRLTTAEEVIGQIRKDLKKILSIIIKRIQAVPLERGNPYQFSG